MKFKKNTIKLSLCILLSIFTFLTSCYSTNKILPSINISENHNWKRIDTIFCRAYYYENDDYVKSKIKDLNEVYKEVFQKFKHYTKTDSKENGKVIFFFLDDDTYKKFTGNTRSGAGWNGKAGFINLDKESRTNLDSTFRHELIHAVTLSSIDTKVSNCPGWFTEGVAQYYQDNINGGAYPVDILKEAINQNRIIPLDDINCSSEQWGTENIPLKYTESASMYEFLIKTYGDEKINNIFYTEGDFYKNLNMVTNKTFNELKKDWLEYIKTKFS